MTTGANSLITLLVGAEFSGRVEVEDYQQLIFGAFTLNVYNPLSIEQDGRKPSARRVVVSATQSAEEVEIVLADETVFRIDLRHDAWSGPEAFALYRGDDVRVVY